MKKKIFLGKRFIDISILKLLLNPKHMKWAKHSIVPGPSPQLLNLLKANKMEI